MSPALFPLALAVTGLPTVVAVVAVFARREVEHHADRTASAIRSASTYRAADRPKEIAK